MRVTGRFFEIHKRHHNVHQRHFSMWASRVYLNRPFGLNLSRSNQELGCSQFSLSLSLSGWLLQEAEVGVAPTHDSVSSCNAVLKTDKSEGLQQVRQKTVNSN